MEAGSTCLRDKLNKRIDADKIFQIAKNMRLQGAKHIKVYFMFGFTQEDNNDLIAIGELLSDLQRQTKLIINASINIFCPKPFSIWEDNKMEEEDVLFRKREIILKNIPKTKKIKISLSNPKRSILETILSRADRDFSEVIYQAFKKGAKFDSYNEHFSWDIWNEAIKESGIDCKRYLDATTDNFPWSFIE